MLLLIQTFSYKYFEIPILSRIYDVFLFSQWVWKTTAKYTFVDFLKFIYSI